MNFRYLPPAYAGRYMFSVASCQSVCLSVQAITFEPFSHIRTSFLALRYILTISRSCLSIKVLRSRSSAKNDYLLISTCYSTLYVATGPLIRSRSNIKVIYVGGLHLNQMRSCWTLLLHLCNISQLIKISKKKCICTHLRVLYSCGRGDCGFLYSRCRQEELVRRMKSLGRAHGAVALGGTPGESASQKFN